MKIFVKSLMYLSGFLGALHRFRNRKTLTVIMLHRVLPKSQLEQQGANEEWTLTDNTFERFLIFLKKHYNIIAFEQLAQVNGQISKLPDRALLLTFDDGWYDNYKYALPIINSLSVPAHIFIATDYINNQKGFWPEQIISSYRIRPSIKDEIARQINDDLIGNDIHEIISYLHEHEPVKINFPGIFELMDPYLPNNRQMMSDAEIMKMATMNVSFGSHGASHSKMGTLNAEAIKGELQRSTERLSSLVNLQTDNLSFPHGNFSDKLINLCRNNGLNHLFTSNACLQAKDSNMHPRIHIAERAITSTNSFSPAKAAFCLFFRERI